MSRFTDYTGQAETGAVHPIFRHDLVSPVGEVLASTDVGAGLVHWDAVLAPLSFRADSVSQRTGSLTVTMSDDRLLDWLDPESGNCVSVHAGLSTDAGDLLWQQAIMCIEATDDTYRAGVITFDLTLADALYPVRTDLVEAFSFEEGEKVETVCQRLIDQVVDNAVIAPTEYTTPAGSREAGKSRYKLLNDLLEGCGFELAADTAGRVISQEIPPSTDDASAERWVYGDDAIPVGDCRRERRLFSAQGWKVTGGTFKDGVESTVTTVYDSDPSSRGFFEGDQATKLPSTDYPFIRSVAQAVDAGFGQLRRVGIGPSRITIEISPNAAMRPGDLVYVSLAEQKINGTYRVLGFDMPYHLERQMTVDLREVYDPRKNFVPLPEVEVGCQTSFSDDFNRDNGAANVGDWVQTAESWVIKDNAVGPVNSNDPTFLRVGTAICATNQFAEVTISRVKPQRPIGPMIRSDGTFSGYSVNCNRSGRYRLYSWLNGVPTLLDDNRTNASPVGRTVRIEAVGSLILVKVNGDLILDVNDSTHQGGFVGITGWGDSASDPPLVDDFSAGEVA